MRTNFLASSLVVFLAMSTLADEPKSVSVKTIEAVLQSVVPVVCARNDGTIKKVMASGFLINRQGYFVTAGHVILTGWDTVQTTDDPCVPAIFEPDTPWTERAKGRKIRWAAFDECQYGKDVDVVACKTRKNLFADEIVNKHIRPASLSTLLNYPDGTPIAFTGFPLGFLFPVTSKGYVAGYAPFSERLVIDKSAWPGASGSPIYDGNGNVIGMITETGIDYGAGLAYALPASAILKFLGENKIPIEK